MRLYNVYGKLQNKNVTKYLIKWNAKSRSKLLFKAKQYLKTIWENQIVYEEFPVFGTKMKVDFLNATKKIAIEVNGPQHANFNKFFHNNSRSEYLRSIKRDYNKAIWLEKNGFKIIEFEQEDVPLLSKEFVQKKFDIAL